MRLSSGQSRLAAVGLLLVVIAVIVGGALLPAWRLYERQNEEILERQASIAQFRRIAANREHFAKSLAELQSRRDLMEVLLEQQSVSLAGASLQERVKQIVQASGGSLVSVQSLDAVEEGPFSRVSVNVQMRLGVDALQRVLYDLESGKPFIVIDQIAVTSKARKRRRTRRTPAGEVEAPMEVRLKLSGFMTSQTAKLEAGA